jgi:hypothetical protein
MMKGEEEQGEQGRQGNKFTGDRCLRVYISFASLRVMSGKDAKIVLRLIYGLGRLAEISRLTQQQIDSGGSALHPTFRGWA